VSLSNHLALRALSTESFSEDNESDSNNKFDGKVVELGLTKEKV
jgi:hypothetical protein